MSFDGGSNNAPPDSDMMQMQLYPKLIKPFNKLIKQIERYYKDEGNAPEYGPGIVQGWNPAQLDAFTGAARTARGGIPGADDFSNWLTGQVGQTAADQYGNSFLRYLGGGGWDNPARDYAGDIVGSAMGDNAGGTGIDTLERFASGDFMGTNPYLSAMYDRGVEGITTNFREATMPSLEGLITRSGSGGGGGLEALLKGQAYDKLGDDLEGFGTNLFGRAYEGDMGRMLSAAGELPGAFSTQLSGQLASNQALGQLWQQDLTNRLAGVGMANDQEREAFERSMGSGQALGGAFNTEMLPFQQLMDWGSRRQSQRERENAEAQEEFRWNDQQAGNFLKEYLSAFGGMAGMTNPGAAAAWAAQQQAQPSGFQQGFGNLLGLGGLGASIYGMSMLNPATAPLAALPLVTGGFGLQGGTGTDRMW